jgi:putative ABC transport system permease protein
MTMELPDLLRYSSGALRGHRLRTSLSVLGIAIGISAVILLTSIGEGTRRYILSQFTQFGTNILAVNPGKTKTLGVPGVLGGTTRKLTIDDSEALRRLPHVEQVVPLAFGQARVEADGKGRSVFIYGVTSEMPDVWKFRVRQGSFLPGGDPRRGSPVCVIGPTLQREIFGGESPLGRFVRIGGTRFRIIGIMEPKGRMLGFDVDDAAYIPVASAMRLFNLDELNEIDVVFSNERLSQTVAVSVRTLLTERHGGNEDFTITTQTAMLDVFDNVMNIVTLSVGGIAGISLVVGAIGILTMMWIAVNERIFEIGLMRALGGTPGQIRNLFLTEAVVIALLGGAVGIGAGMGIATLLRTAVPGLPVYTPPGYVLVAFVVSFVTGLLAGVVPAQRAAVLDPIEALRAE